MDTPLWDRNDKSDLLETLSDLSRKDEGLQIFRDCLAQIKNAAEQSGIFKVADNARKDIENLYKPSEGFNRDYYQLMEAITVASANGVTRLEYRSKPNASPN